MRSLIPSVLIFTLISCENFRFKLPSNRLPSDLTGSVLISARLNGSDYGVFTVNIEAGILTKEIDLIGSDEIYPRFLGDTILFCSNVGGDYDVFSYDGDISTLYSAPGDQIHPSGYGRYIAFVTYELGSDGDLALYNSSERSFQVWRDRQKVSHPVFMDSSHILALRGVYLQTFSLDSLNWRTILKVGNAYSVSPSPDGRFIAYVSEGDSFYIILYPGGKVLKKFEYTLRGLAWSPDGKYLAFGYRDALYALDTLGNLYLIKDSLPGVWVGDWVM